MARPWTWRMADARTAGRGAAFGLLILGSLVGLLLATQTWWTHPGGDITGNLATATLTGVLAGAAAAGTGLAALSGRRARLVLGVLLLALGVGMVVVAITASPDAAARSASTLIPDQGVTATGVRWAYLATGVLVATGAGTLLARARHWPARRDRYARLRARATTTAEDDPAEVWKAMDAGFDPTEAGPDSDPTGRNRSDRGE